VKARLGKRLLGGRPTLVLALSRHEPVLRQARQLGIAAVELRLDAMPSPTAASAIRLARTLRAYDLPLLATVRRRAEGGGAALSDPQRGALFEAVLPAVDAIDIEIASAPALTAIITAARRAKKTVLLSCHNFRGTPSTPRLEALLAKAQRGGADIFKIAATPKSAADILRLFDFTVRHRRDNVVVIAMGPLGSISRLLFPLAGSLLTYTNVKPSLGQIPLRAFAADLKRYYPAGT